MSTSLENEDLRGRWFGPASVRTLVIRSLTAATFADGLSGIPQTVNTTTLCTRRRDSKEPHKIIIVAFVTCARNTNAWAMLPL
jgi:hypothetical protein